MQGTKEVVCVMKTGGICNIEWAMAHSCHGCKIAKLCEERDKLLEVAALNIKKNDLKILTMKISTR